jgi:hypothetical protein
MGIGIAAMSTRRGWAWEFSRTWEWSRIKANDGIENVERYEYSLKVQFHQERWI